MRLTEGWVTFYWLFVWLTVGFGVPETLALATKHPEYTLSETSWRMFDVLPGQTLFEWNFAHLIVACLLFWLFVHISFGIWR